MDTDREELRELGAEARDHIISALRALGAEEGRR